MTSHSNWLHDWKYNILSQILFPYVWSCDDFTFQILERALQECGNDLDVAIKSLHELCLESTQGNLGSPEESDVNVEKGMLMCYLG